MQCWQSCIFQRRRPRQGRFSFFHQMAAVRAAATPAEGPGSVSATERLTEHQDTLPAPAKHQDEHFKTFTLFLNTLLHTTKFISAFLIKWPCIMSLLLLISSVFSFPCFLPCSSPYCLMDLRQHHRSCAKCISYASSEISSFRLFLMCLLFLQLPTKQRL